MESTNSHCTWPSHLRSVSCPQRPSSHTAHAACHSRPSICRRGLYRPDLRCYEHAWIHAEGRGEARCTEADAWVLLTDGFALFIGKEHVGGEATFGCIWVCSGQSAIFRMRAWSANPSSSSPRRDLWTLPQLWRQLSAFWQSREAWKLWKQGLGLR